MIAVPSVTGFSPAAFRPVRRQHIVMGSKAALVIKKKLKERERLGSHCPLPGWKTSHHLLKDSHFPLMLGTKVFSTGDSRDIYLSSNPRVLSWKLGETDSVWNHLQILPAGTDLGARNRRALYYFGYNSDGWKEFFFSKERDFCLIEHQNLNI